MTTETAPYDEPHAEISDYPSHWSPKQRENWDEHCQTVYENLETDIGRKFFRRTWRPKMRGDGYMKRDHVKFGTPEDYVAYNVNDATDMWADITGAMMRELTNYSVDTDELDKAVKDIVQARLKLLSPEERMELGKDALAVARAYGLEIEQ